MKKLFAIILSIILCFSLFSILIACGEKDNGKDKENNQIENNQTDNNDQNQDSGQTGDNDQNQDSENQQDSPSNNLPTSIVLSETTINLSTGETHQLYATVSPLIDNVKVTWSSLNPAVATVDNTGNITCISEGTSVIRAVTENNLVASCTVNVTLSLGNLEINVTAQPGWNAAIVPDVDASIIVIPENLEEFPLDFSIYGDYKTTYGIYTGKTDLDGKKVFNKIPIGKYRVIVISNKIDVPNSIYLSYFDENHQPNSVWEERAQVLFGDNLYIKL